MMVSKEKRDENLTLKNNKNSNLVSIDKQTEENSSKGEEKNNINALNDSNESNEKLQQNELIYEYISSKNTTINIIFLGLGASSLALVKVPYHISLISTLFCISIVAATNIWSYITLGDLYEVNRKKRSISNQINDKNEIKEINNIQSLYLKITEKSPFLSKLYIPLIIIMNIYTIFEIIVHQILLYILIGEIINIIGQYGYDDIESFFSGTYFGEKKMKFLINFIFSCLILYAIALNKGDNKKIFNSSIIGFAIMLILFILVLIQFIFYFTDYYFTRYNNINDLNVYHIERGFTKQGKFFQSFSIFCYCFSGHNGFIPAIDNIKGNKSKIINRKSFKISNILKGVAYLIFSCAVYLSVPDNVVDIAIERKKFWKNDINMTICRVLLIPFCISKIQINFHFFRDSLFSIMNECINNIDNNKYANFLLSFITLSITTLISSLYQNIQVYITIVGGFCASFLIYLFPQIMNYYYNYDKKEINKRNKNKCYLIQLLLGIVCSFIGLVGGIFGIFDLINGNF